MSKHLDLFSGIGGFALAADRVFGDVEHIFCEIDPFCQEVLKKHYPNSKIYGDIRSITDTRSIKPRRISSFKRKEISPFGKIDILTGGFPCQPFSQAGRRKGTSDDRHLWPEMLRVIRLTKPTWIIAENVRGLLTIGEGMVFKQVCTDLEGEGYEVQPVVIPAVALNAPHRRDRVWFIAHSGSGEHRGWRGQKGKAKGVSGISRETRHIRGIGGADKISDSNTDCARQQGNGKRGSQVKGQSRLFGGKGNKQGRYSWEANWLEVAARLCRMDDGIPKRMDRTPRLKALGNAIVPQIAYQIMKSIK